MAVMIFILHRNVWTVHPWNLLLWLVFMVRFFSTLSRNDAKYSWLISASPHFFHWREEVFSALNINF